MPLLDAVETNAQFRVRRSRRARHLSIQIHPPGFVEIVVPLRMPVKEVESFIAEKAKWIRKTRESMANGHVSPGTTPPDLLRLDSIDREWKIEYIDRADYRYKILEQPDRLQVVGPADANEKRKALLHWLKRKAKAVFVPQIQGLADETGLQPAKIQIRAQRSRWGSCSSSRTVSLNLCLLFQDPVLVRYLLIHELCHLRHMNHSARFWSLVDRFAPGGKNLDDRLAEGWKNIPGWILTEL